jgi:hypothetical protein
MAFPLWGGVRRAGGSGLRYHVRGSPCIVLLGSRLATVTRRAQALTIRHAVPFAALRDRHDVIGVSLAVIAAHSAAGPAGPGVTREHRLPPCSMGAVTVAACCRARPRRFISTAGRWQAGRLVAGDALGHGACSVQAGANVSGLPCDGGTPAIRQYSPRCRALGPCARRSTNTRGRGSVVPNAPGTRP